jgi:hypothetical protein
MSFQRGRWKGLLDNTALKVGFSGTIPTGLMKQQRTERTGSLLGGKGKEEEDKRFLFHP